MEMRKRKTGVLVVDEKRAVKEPVKKYLRARGFSVLSVDSGEDALPIIIGLKPDIVLLNPDLSGMSGGRLLRLARKSVWFPKFIVLKSKPVNRVELVSMLRDASLDKERLQRGEDE